MSPRARWLLSWTPVLSAALLLFTLWFFIIRSPSPQPLLPPFCQGEKVEEIKRGNMLFAVREEGCGQVEGVGEVFEWFDLWQERREEILLPEPRRGSRVDIRPRGESRVFVAPNRPGEILLVPGRGEQGRWEFWKLLNEMVLQEIFPRRNWETLSGALAARISPGGSLRLVLSPEERELADNLRADWAEVIRRCRRCEAELSRK